MNVEEIVKKKEVVMEEEDKEAVKMDVEVIMEDEVNVKEIVIKRRRRRKIRRR